MFDGLMSNIFQELGRTHMLRYRNINGFGNAPTGASAPVARSRGMPWRLPFGWIVPCKVTYRP
jgi:hypothetical protein